MILLTGATGLIGRAVLRQLLDGGHVVRCLVRDPRGLGEDRVRVQIALGDLAEPASFRNALRGVQTVVHLASASRDQRSGSIEEHTTIATWRLVRAAERARVERFVFVSGLGANPHHRTRLLRAKALAEQVLLDSPVPSVVLAASLVYGANDAWSHRVSQITGALPFAPTVGRGDARFQPIAAQDVAACIVGSLSRTPVDERIDVAGPETLTHREMMEATVRAQGRRRRILPVPESLAAGVCEATEALLRGAAPVSWDQAELLTTSMVSPTGTDGARSLGVNPRRFVDGLAELAPLRYSDA